MPSEKDFTHEFNPLCQNVERWSARDEQSAEDEVGDFIYGLVRLLKPKVAIETGCYLGDTTVAISKAIEKNAYGKFLACDTDEEKVNAVLGRFPALSSPVEVLKMSGEELINKMDEIDFAFVDSGLPTERIREIGLIIPKLSRFGMIALHDVAPQHKLLHELSQQIALSRVYLNCPRGLMLYCKDF
jgi:predicted O-methyltransferase YrrM